MSSSEPPASPPGTDWVAAITHPDRRQAVQAFEALFQTFAQDLWQFASRYVPAALADDIVQEVFLTLWQRRHALVIHSTFTAYLFGAVRRKAFMLRRHDQTVQRLEANVTAGATNWRATPPDIPDALASLAELERALEHAMAQLPERTRELLVLRWKHGLTYEQIAEVMGISVAAAKMQVSRMGKVIRPLLERFTT